MANRFSQGVFRPCPHPESESGSVGTSGDPGGIMTKEEWIERYEQWREDALDPEISFTKWMGVLTNLVHSAKDIFDES